jgi:hypothetical protein
MTITIEALDHLVMNVKGRRSDGGLVRALCSA